MLRPCWICALVVIAPLSLSAGVNAQGKAKGLSKALSNANGKGGANAALNRAGQNASRVGGSVNRANRFGRASELGRGSLGATRGSAVPQGEPITTRQADAPARHQRQLTIEQTNRDRRIAQAQHLREIAARNGNAKLAANADRMEALALEHYQERVEHLARFGVADAPAPDAAADAPANDPAPTPDPPTP